MGVYPKSNMIIAIDVRPLMGGNTSGVEVYIQNLLHHLFKADSENTYILYFNGAKREEQFLKSLRQKAKQKNVHIVHTHYPNKVYNALLTFLRWPKLDKVIEKRTGKRSQAFLFPDLRPGPVSRDIKKISVVHDLAYEHFPQFFSWRTRLWYFLIHPKKEIQESHGIIAVSEFTKRDIIQTYNIEEHKISVVYEGVSEEFDQEKKMPKREDVQKKYHLPKNYFLFLSTLEPRKNIHQLIKAFKTFRKETRSNIELVIAGKPNPRIFSKAASPEAEGIHFPGFISEEDKASLYKGAQAFIYPSIFEGFGLPLLEAMKCQTPIITSNTSSIPEVVGDAALLVNPDKSHEITKAMKKILKPDIRKELRSKMKQQVKRFTWDRCAAETLRAIYLSS